MDTETFEELLNNASYENREGVQKGLIVRKSNDGVLLDLSTKAEKFIPRSDFFDDEWDNLNVGAEITVVIDEGKASYSKARRTVAMEDVKENYKNKTPVSIKIKRAIKGGFLASFKGIEVFVPMSLSGRTGGIKEGESCLAVITRFEEEEDKVVCSVRDYENILRDNAFSEFFKTMKPGDETTGVVKNIIEKGVFADIGGIDGFIPFSEITHRRIKSPQDVVAKGDKVSVKILDMNVDAKKVTLSMKAFEEDPWVAFLNRFKEGDRIAGEVRNIINQGVFVEVLNGLDGFIHLSEMSWTERVNDPKKFFKSGDRVECLIKRIDRDQKKISLSFRDVLANPWLEFIEKHGVGSVVNAAVKEIADKGIVVSLSMDMEGFIPNEYVAWSRINETKKQFNLSEEIAVKFMEGSAQKRKLIFSIRDISQDPWAVAASSIKAGQEIEGAVSGITDKIIFIELMPHVEGIVRKVEFIDKDKSRKDVSVKVGDKLFFLVKEVDWDRRRILLSHRDLETRREKEAMEEFRNKNVNKVTFGDFFKKQA
jgi:small subunit ribosomal protein S1